MKRLNDKQVRLLAKGFGPIGPRKYLKASVLFYEGQVPTACFLLLEGEITLLKRNKIVKEIGPGHIVGFADFQTASEASVTARISAGSWVMIIDKSTFVELAQHEDSEMKRIVS